MKKVYKQFRVQIPQEEIEGALSELTPRAYQLLIYYYSKNDGFIFDNKVIANILSISTRQLSTYHKELREKKYLRIQRGATTIYFVGKNAVLEYEDEKVKKAGVIGQAQITENETFCNEMATATDSDEPEAVPSNNNVNAANAFD